MAIKIILTGSTGMVGEGVLMECLEHPDVQQVLMVNRRHNTLEHPKLTELIVPDFFNLDGLDEALTGYDACLYCAGISSNGVNEADYTSITYDTPLHLANKLLSLNPNMVFSHVSGSHTDGTEKGRIMWARVKGRAENALMQLPFKKVYNFRPGFMKPTKGQKNVKGYYKVIGSAYPVLHALFPNNVSTMKQVGLAMINSILKGYSKPILEVPDIKALARE